MSEATSDLFTPHRLLDISSTSGHIGRIYWCNQMHLSYEVCCDDGSYQRKLCELPGSCTFISTMADFWEWVFS